MNYFDRDRAWQEEKELFHEEMGAPAPYAGWCQVDTGGVCENPPTASVGLETPPQRC